MSIIISNEIKRDIIDDYTSNVQTIKSLSDKYNLSQPTISKILKKKIFLYIQNNRYTL